VRELSGQPPTGTHLNREPSGHASPAERAGAVTARGGAGRRVIWFVNQYAGSPVHGMEFRHYELGRALVEMGHSVVVISGSYSHLFARQPSITGTYTVEDIDGIAYCWVKVPAYRRAVSLGRVINMLVFMVRLYRLPSSGLGRPDAIVVSSPSLFPILPAERLARRRRSLLLFEVRDLWPMTLQELGGLPRFHPLVMLMRWFEGHAYRVADVVISLLPAARGYLESRGMAASKLRILPNGATPATLDEPAVALPDKVAAVTARHRFNVGFVGTLGVAANLEPLLDTARILADDDIGFVIVGQGSDEARYRALASGLPNVAFTGAITKAEVPAALRAFDACYIGLRRSRLYEFGISPNKIFEYMAASRPIILAADGATDWVREAGGLAVPAEDPVAAADAIRALRDMTSEERARVGARERAYVEREHTYPKLAARLMAAIDAAGR
jgi:glycosyltransferase involved in cell wall biosynthesis